MIFLLLSVALDLPQELNRVSDPDRPFEDRSSTRQHSKVDEARHLKGPSMIFLLGSIASSSACVSCIVPFLYSLLGGAGSSISPVAAIRQGYSVSATFSPAYFGRVKELFLYFCKGVDKNPGLDAHFHMVLSRRFLTAAVAALQLQLLHPLQLQRAGRWKEAMELSLVDQQLQFQYTLPGSKLSGKRNRKSDYQYLSELRGSTAPGDSAVDGSGNPPVVDSRGVLGRQSVAQQNENESRATRVARLLRDDMAFFRSLLVAPASHLRKRGATSQFGASVSADNEASSTEDSDRDTDGLRTGEEGDGEWQVPHSVTGAMRTADRFRNEALRAAARARKHRLMITQPGAATGCSLDQALANRGASRAAAGFDASARASALGYLGLRLLQFGLRKYKAESKMPSVSQDCTVPGAFQHQQGRPGVPVVSAHLSSHGSAEQLAIKPILVASHGKGKGKRTRSLVTEEHQWLMEELERTVPNLLVCFCSSDNELVSWAARCLLQLIPLRLSELERRGAVVAYVTLRVFQSAGTGNSLTQQQLLPSCTRLLAMVLLRPQASTWMQTALHGRVPFSHRELLLQQLSEQAELQRKIGGSPAAMHSESDATYLPVAVRSAGAGGSSLNSVHGEVETDQMGNQSILTTINGGGRNSWGSDPDGSGGHLVLSEAQLQVLKAHELALESHAAEKERRVDNFKEALLAQVLHALEDSQLRLCGLMLFKGVVLPHYREAAVAAVAGEAEKAGQQRGDKRKKKEKGGLADCSLLHEVYKGVNTIGRLMIQEAGGDNEGRRLAAICADVYVHFLLNYPMTEKLQQRRVLFLLRNLQYPAAEGRRSVLNCVHKVLVRSPL